jgi:hypothetical protein
MGVKLFAAALGLAFVLSLAPSSSKAGAFEEGAYAATHRRAHYVIFPFGPRLHYAPVVVRALFDSCWRYRQSRGPERIWICVNYVKPNAEFDWSYGTSIADQIARYGYP